MVDTARMDSVNNEQDFRAVRHAAQQAAGKSQQGTIPFERNSIGVSGDSDEPEISKDNTQVSLRVSVRGLLFSLIDEAPAEVALVTLKNLNFIASWDTKRKLDATAFLTLAAVQVDNMVPNAPYPVAVTRSDNSVGDNQNDHIAPVVVVGLSFAPRHSTGTMVRNLEDERYGTQQNLTCCFLSV